MNDKADATHPKKTSRKMLALLLLLSLLLFLGITEVGVRILLPDVMGANNCYMFHKDRYWTLRPGASSKEYFRSHEGKIDLVVTIDVSAQGLRDRDYGIKKEDEYRILMLGDSFVYGKGVEGHDTIPKQLERVCAKNQTDNISVINGGIEGYGPFQERHLLHEIGFPLKPDMVVMSIFVGNDIEDTMREHNLQRKSLHAFFEQRHFLLRNRDKWNYALEYFLRRHWLTLPTCSRYLGIPAEGSIGALLEGKAFPPEYHPLYGAENLGHLPYLEPELKEWYPELKQGLELMLEDVKQIQQDCQKRNIGFLVFTIPTQETVYDSIWNNLIASSPYADLYERGKGIRVLREALEREEFPYIAVAESVMKSDQDINLYISYDGHLNKDGCRLVAEVIYKELIQHYPELLLCGKPLKHTTLK